MQRIKYLAITIAVFSTVVLYALEFSWFDRTLDVRRLVLWSMAIGALPGLALAWRFRQSAKDLTEKVQLYVFFMIICVIFAPLAGSLSNRLLSPYPVRTQAVMVMEEQASKSEPFGLIVGEKPEITGYFSFFYYEGKLRRIKNKTPLFSGRQRGETAMLRMQKGLWGLEVVMKEQDSPR